MLHPAHDDAVVNPLKMFPASVCFLLVLSLLPVSGGGPARAQTAAYIEKSVRNGGTISGTVRLAGEAKPAESMPITKDEKLCGARTPAPRLLLGKQNGVGNTIVMIKEIAAGKPASKKKVTLDQRQCVYMPHVMGIARGTPLEIVNSDPVLHNVHAYHLGKSTTTIFNIAQPVRGQRTPIRKELFQKAGMVLATCDAGHPWMSAYILVSDHPYFAVTDADGRFTIDNVPPGNYTLVMWHEGVAIARTEMEHGSAKKYTYEEPYVVEKEIAVKPNEAVTADFRLALR